MPDAVDDLPAQIHQWQTHYQQDRRHLGAADDAQRTERVTENQALPPMKCEPDNNYESGSQQGAGQSQRQ